MEGGKKFLVAYFFYFLQTICTLDNDVTTEGAGRVGRNPNNDFPCFKTICLLSFRWQRWGGQKMSNFAVKLFLNKNILRLKWRLEVKNTKAQTKRVYCRQEVWKWCKWLKPPLLQGNFLKVNAFNYEIQKKEGKRSPPDRWASKMS